MSSSDFSHAYSVPEDSEYAGKVYTTISETYNQEGAVWVQMKVEIPGSGPYYVEFDNPDQLRECWEAMGKYIQNRGIFRRARLGDPCLNEPNVNYGS